MSVSDPTRIYSVIRYIGRDWRTFVRTKLQLSDMDIEECEENYHRDLNEQRYQMVVKWQRRCGFIATVDLLEEHAYSWKGVPALPPQVAQQQQRGQLHHGPSNIQTLGASATYNEPAGFTPTGDSPSPLMQVRNGNATNPSGSLLQEKGRESGSPGARKDSSSTGDATVARKAFSPDSTGSSCSSSLASLKDPPAGIAMQDCKKKKKMSFKKLKKLFNKIEKPPVEPNSSLSIPPTPGGDDTSGYCDSVGTFHMYQMSEEVYQKLSKSKSIYGIHKPKGLCLILNNSFQKYVDGKRHGSHIDVENMKKLWKNVGCEMHRGEPQCDKTADQMKQLLLEVAKVRKKYSFIVVVIMTHGGMENEDLIFKGEDGKSIKVNKIREMFNNKNAELLQNVPKIFILQFCRGKTIDKGVSADAHSIEKAIKTIVHSHGQRSSDAVEADGSLLPTTSDLLIAFATHEDHAALRHPERGSWFINAITNVFMRNAGSEHVADMLTRTHRAMKEKEGQYAEKDYSGQVVGTHPVKGMSMHETSLTKFLYLFPGH